VNAGAERHQIPNSSFQTPKMISREKARQLAMAKILAGWSVPGDEPEINDAATLEEDFGWVFIYNSKRYFETKNILFTLAGNGPVIVDKDSGEVTRLGSAGGVEHQLNSIGVKEQKGDQNRPDKA
jgi:hypothetical protein